VIAADHLRFRQFAKNDVAVRGWPQLKTAAQQDKWIGAHSDHAMLYLEVQRV